MGLHVALSECVMKAPAFQNCKEDAGTPNAEP